LDTVCWGSKINVGFKLTGQSPWNIVYTDGALKDTVKHVVKSDSSFKVAPLQQKVYQILSIIDSNSCDINSQVDPIFDTIVVNKLPTPNFNYTSLHCEKMKMTFLDDSKPDLDQLVKWYWDFGNNDTISVLNSLPIDRIFDKAGVDTIKLVVASSMGCVSDTLKKALTIFHLPNVGFEIPNVCLDGGMATFKDTTKYPYFPTTFTYTWNFNTGLNPITPGPTYTANQLTKSNPSVLYNIGGDYNVSLKVTTAEGCTDSLINRFTINGSNPIASFKVLKDTALCSNQSVVIVDSSWVYPGRVGLLHIYWGDGQDSVIENAVINTKYQHLYSINPQTPNLNYNIKIKAYSGGTCLDSAKKDIHIVTPPQKVSLAASQDYLCINDSLLINSSIVGGILPYDIQLVPNNTNAFTKGNYVYGLTKGAVSLGMTLTDTKSCIYNYTDLLALNLPVLPVANLMVKDTVICNGDSVLLKGAGSDIYKWYQGTSLFKTTQVDSIGIFTPGTYSLVVNDGKCNSLSTPGFKIIAFNIPSFTFSTNPIACTNGYLTINTDAVEKYKIHFLWNFGDSSSSILPLPPSHNYAKTGTYQISLQVTNDYCPKYEYTLLGDSINVIEPLKPTAFTMFVLSGIDTLLSPLKVDSGYVQYLWSPLNQLSNPSIARPVFNGTETTTYTLMREDPTSGCRIYDVYTINVSSDVVVSVPKAFTPNNDNLNDKLKIEHGAGVKQLNYFNIYNRWGKLVFTTNNITEGWNGTFENEPQLMDQYNYVIDYITYKEEHIRKVGSFLLIR
jgi:gliding motility-associated-like protein